MFKLSFYFQYIGNVYISDRNNHCIRKVTFVTGIITTIAGTSTASYSGDNGDATSAALKFPWGVVVDSAGQLEFTRYIYIDLILLFLSI